MRAVSSVERPFEIAQHERGALLFREHAEAEGEDALAFSGGEGLLGVGGRGGKLFGVVDRILGTAAAALVVAGVDGDAVEPTGEAGGIEFGEIAVELEEDVLGDVLCVGEAAGEAERGDQDEAFVLAHEAVEGGEVAGAGGFEGGASRRHIGGNRHGCDRQGFGSFRKVKLRVRENRVCKIRHRGDVTSNTFWDILVADPEEGQQHEF